MQPPTFFRQSLCPSNDNDQIYCCPNNPNKQKRGLLISIETKYKYRALRPPYCGFSNATHTRVVNTNIMGLLLALTVHAVLEGLAVGLQKATSEVFLLVGAVASHKFVVGFCLGLELAGANSTLFRLVIAILCILRWVCSWYRSRNVNVQNAE